MRGWPMVLGLFMTVFWAGSPPAEAQIYKYKGYIIFPSNEEELYADVEQNFRTGIGKMKGQTSKGVKCQGTARPTSMSTNAICFGQTAELQFTCSDGRSFNVPLLLENCTQGAGAGFNKNDPNDMVYVAFGGLEYTLKKRAIAHGNLVAKMVHGDNDMPSPSAPDGLISAGTGFFVSGNGILVTNYHVVQNGSRFNLFDSKNKNMIPAKLLSADPINDLAILESELKSKPIPLAANFNLKRGEDVLTLGYPQTDLQGVEQKATFGKINAPTGDLDDVRYIQIDLPIQPGNSGGPLISDQGEVVGVITKRLINKESQNVNYALKIDYLAPLLMQKAPAVKPSSGPGPLPMPKLVERFEDSVVMVLTYQ